MSTNVTPLDEYKCDSISFVSSDLSYLKCVYDRFANASSYTARTLFMSGDRNDLRSANSAYKRSSKEFWGSFLRSSMSQRSKRGRWLRERERRRWMRERERGRWMRERERRRWMRERERRRWILSEGGKGMRERERERRWSMCEEGRKRDRHGSTEFNFRKEA